MRSKAMLVRPDERIIRNSAIPRRKKGEIHVREVPRMKRQPHDRIRRIATLPRHDPEVVSGLSYVLDSNKIIRFTISVHLHDVDLVCITQTRRNPHKIPSRKAKQKILSASCQAHLSRGHHQVAVFFYSNSARTPFTAFPSHRVAIASVDFDGSVK